MKYKFIPIPLLNSTQMEHELNSFIAGHRVVSVDKEFVNNGDRSYWAVCITYLESGTVPAGQKSEKIDYKAVLNEKEFAVFTKFRSLRKELSEKEGIPAYAIFTNDQLAAMIQKRAHSISEIISISGVGKGRAEKYGNEFLSLLREINEPTSQETGNESNRS